MTIELEKMIAEVKQEEILSQLSTRQKWALDLGCIVYLEHRKRFGWSKSLPFYAFKCPKHGVFEDYPHGHRKRIDCPKCLEEVSESE